MFPEKLSKKICNNLYSEIPEFRIYVDEHVVDGFHENSYLVFGPLGSFLNNLIISDENPVLIKKIFHFINNLCDERITDIETMLEVTFFEHVMDYKKTITLSKMELQNRALDLFNEILNSPLFGGGIYAQ